MKYFVHLKDNVVFAAHQSENEVDVDGDNIYEVPENGELYLNKKYDNGKYVDAPVIKYATIDSNGTVVAINTTLFSSEVGDNPIITNDDVKILWTWDGNEFHEPEIVEPLDVIWVDSEPVTTSRLAPALTQEQLEEIAAKVPLQIEQPIVPEEIINPVPEDPIED